MNGISSQNPMRYRNAVSNTHQQKAASVQTSFKGGSLRSSLSGANSAMADAVEIATQSASQGSRRTGIRKAFRRGFDAIRESFNNRVKTPIRERVIAHNIKKAGKVAEANRKVFDKENTTKAFKMEPNLEFHTGKSPRSIANGWQEAYVHVEHPVKIVNKKGHTESLIQGMDLPENGIPRDGKTAWAQNAVHSTLLGDSKTAKKAKALTTDQQTYLREQFSVIKEALSNKVTSAKTTDIKFSVEKNTKPIPEVKYNGDWENMSYYTMQA